MTTTLARATTSPASQVRLDPVLTLSLGQRVGQLRAMPVGLGPGAPRAFLAAYSADFENDPSMEMFFYPTDTLKLALFDERGDVLWRKDLGRGVVPGLWFCPVFAFDLDGDRADEIWFVNNLNTQHPFGLSGYQLERLDPHTGQTTGQWPWPKLPGEQNLSHTFRNFILGGASHGEPVLVTAQGTYGHMQFQAWRIGPNGDLIPRWTHEVTRDAPGARGSHMCAVADLNEDGVDELLWGERCIELDTGRELFTADRDSYRGHSDIAQPWLDRSDGTWRFFACRESDRPAAPRVCMYDARGNRLWGHVDEGHMDIGWVARLGLGRTGEPGEYVAMSIRIGQKFCGPDGRWHNGTEEFSWDARTGEPLPLPFSAYRTIPVDLDGDGFHEIVRGQPSGDGEVWDARGTPLGSVSGPVAMASKLLDLPGEQLLSYREDGTVQLWADRNANDAPAALARYAHSFYRTNQRLTGAGYNLINLAGI